MALPCMFDAVIAPTTKTSSLIKKVLDEVSAAAGPLADGQRFWPRSNKTFPAAR